MQNRSLLTLALATSLAAATAQAQVERQHASHVHGVGVANVSLDASELRVELEIPGINLVGFEHAPRSDQERAGLEEVLSLLRAADWLATDPRGSCEIASISAHTHGFDDSPDDHAHDGEHAHPSHAESGHAHDHAHADGHDHAHDHEHGHEHAEFHVVVNLDCQAAERLAWVDLRLFDAFPGNERLDVNVLTDRLATQVRLGAGNSRVSLQ